MTRDRTDAPGAKASGADAPAALREEWATLRESDPKIRTRAAAAEVGVSEAELVATRIGDGVRRIEPDVETLLSRLEALGEVMALTRNDLFVHEKTGIYRNVYFDPHVASVANPRIDLRIFPARWSHGFAVEATGRRARRKSLQFFDDRGVAVHKIFLLDGSDEGAWEALVEDLLHDDQSRSQAVAAPEPAAEPPPDDEVEVAALVGDWEEMEDTHDFHGLLRRHGVDRTQALRLVPDELARRAAPGALRALLERASAEAVELMVFVRSPGTLQIHHGPVDRIVDTPPWLNVLDPGFNLHVREAEIGSAWVVRKPTGAGRVTSLELYDADGGLAALVFGERERGEPEDPAWRAVADGLAGPGADDAGTER